MVEFSEWTDTEVKIALGRAAHQVLALSKELAARGYVVEVDAGVLTFKESGIAYDSVK